MHQIDVDAVGLERAQGILQLALDSVGGEVADDGVLALAGAVAAKLGGQDPLVAAALDRFADHRFGEMVRAVAGGAVDQIEAQLRGAVKNALDLFVRKFLAPVAAVLPGSEADRGDTQAGLTKNAIFHKMIPFFVQKVFGTVGDAGVFHLPENSCVGSRIKEGACRAPDRLEELPGAPEYNRQGVIC